MNKEELKYKKERKNELTNLIMNYAIENNMSFKSVEESLEDCKEIFLSDGLIIKKDKAE